MLSFVCLILSACNACQYGNTLEKYIIMITISDHQWQSLIASQLLIVDAKSTAVRCMKIQIFLKAGKQIPSEG